MAEQAQQRLLAYLKDVHGLEQMSLQMTESAAKAAKDPELRALFAHHHHETQEHELLIRRRIEAHDATPSTIKEMGARIAAMLKSLEAMLPEDAPARLVRDAYVQEQIEIASYELLWRIAGRAGDTETADVSRRILQNERETADKIAGMWGHAAEPSMKADTAA